VPTGSKPAWQRVAGPLYVDTSALLKLYFPESDSSTVNELLRGRRDAVISQLAITEMVSALARRCRQGALEPDAAVEAHAALLSHIESGVFRCDDLFSDTHREAERILFGAATASLRAADALHLAVARGAGVTTVLTFDVRMAEVARSIGFVTIP